MTVMYGNLATLAQVAGLGCAFALMWLGIGATMFSGIDDDGARLSRRWFPVALAAAMICGLAWAWLDAMAKAGPS